MRRPWATLAVTAVAGFVVYLDVTVVAIAFPSMQATFSTASRSELSWVLSAYNAIFAALLLAAGRLADRAGRRWAFLTGLAVFTTASALCALAPTPAALIAGRVLQAAGGATLVPAGLALLLAAFAPERWGLAVALWAGAGAIAAAIGPSLGGLLVEGAGWRWIFVANLPVGAVALATGRRLLSESREPGGTARPDLTGAALITAAVGLLALGLVQSQQWGWDSAGVIASFVGSALLAPALVVRVSRHPAPVVDPALLRLPSVGLANAASLLLGTAFLALLFSSVLFLTSVWGYGALTAGGALSPAPALSALTAAVGGRLADRCGPRSLAACGTVLFALGALWLIARVGARPDYAGAWLPGALLTGAGLGLAVPTLIGASVRAVPARQFAAASALNGTTRQIGAVLGVAVVVAIVGTPTPANAIAAFHAGWGFVAATALAALPACLRLGRIPAARAAPAPGAT